MPPVLLKACLNGMWSRADHPALPVTPEELAREAAAAVDAGAAAVHVHPRGMNGRESLDAEAIGAAVAAIRDAAPDIPVGVSTGEWIEPNLEARLAAIESWRNPLPDFASVNLSEEGAAAVIEALRRRGIGWEAGVWLDTDVEKLVEMGSEGCVRVLVEIDLQPDAGSAVRDAERLDAALDEAGIALPRLHHGLGPATWSVIERALELGRDIRVGLEDTFLLPDGTSARDNADLVAAAASMAVRMGKM